MVQSATAGARRTAPLRGDNVRLRAVEEGDLPLLVRWMNDPEVRYWLLHSDADNARGIRGYEKCGFVREGVMRESRLRYGKPLDMLLMAVLRDEWQVDSEQ